MRHEKLTEVSVSYFFRVDHYTVVMETVGMKYSTKKESKKNCKSHGTIDLSFKIKLKLIVFFISQFYANLESSNCFDIINSFCRTGTLTN